MDKEAIKVLLVDDEANIRYYVKTGLQARGMIVKDVGNGTDGFNAAQKLKPDIILLDVSLPDMGGIAVAKKLRASNIDIPIIFISAREEPEDRVAGLGAGGDDYIPKTKLSISEIEARIMAVLRRVRRPETKENIMQVGEITINEDAHEVFVGNQMVELSPTEYKLLSFLMSNANRVMSKGQILDHVWEYDFGGEQGIVESYVSYLRKKLDDLTSEPVIVTKRGVGYMFKAAK